jgi:APA family basic amino acid/polyamine antiporter
MDRDEPCEAKPAELTRALGPSMATAVVVGSVIGSGIFLKPGHIAADTGHFGVILFVWMLGGLLCALGALCFAELATMLPRAGGLYVYLRAAYGDLVAFLFGWTETLLARPASTGALAVAFVGSLAVALDWKTSEWTQVVLASLLVFGLALVNILGVVWGGRMQLAVTLVKAGFLAFVMLSPLLLAPWSGWLVDAANYGTTVEPRQATWGAQLGAALLAVLWAYNGWDAVTPLAEEIKDPERNLPLALFLGVGLLVVLYAGANVAYHGVLSMEEMRAAGDHAAERMLERLAGPSGRLLMSAVIMCSTFGAINTNLLYGPRVGFAMARDGLFFRSLAGVHARFRSPVVAILLSASLAIVMMVAITWGKSTFREVAVEDSARFYDRVVRSLQADSTFDLLTNLVIFSLSVFYALAVLAVILLRRRFPEWPRSYRTWGYPWTPAVFLVVYVWFLGQVYRGNPVETRAGLGVLLAGVPAYWWFRRK